MNVRTWLSKTEYIPIRSRPKIMFNLQLKSKGPIKRVNLHAKMLGVNIDEILNRENHIECIASKISSGIGAINKLKEFVNQGTLVLMYNALIQLHFGYCCEVWDEFGKGLSDRLQKLQNLGAGLIMNLSNEHGQSILARNWLGWTTIEERRAQMKAKLMYKTMNTLAPQTV